MKSLQCQMCARRMTLGKTAVSPINHCHMLPQKWILQDTTYSSF